MKCPHCSQEHPEGTKYCPETGKRICEETRKWSSVDDFERGDIVVDGVILGKTTLPDLRKKGIEIETIDFETGEEGNMFYAYLGKGRSITASISRLTYKDFERIKDDRRSILLDKKTILQSYNVVTGLAIELWDNECPLLGTIGIEPEEDDDDESLTLMKYQTC